MYTREHSNFRRACRTETKGLRDFSIFIQYSQMILYDITVDKWLIQKNFFLKMADLLGYPTHASHITEVKAVHSCALCGDFFLDISKDSKLMMGMDLLFIVLLQ